MYIPVSRNSSRSRILKSDYSPLKVHDIMTDDDDDNVKKLGNLYFTYPSCHPRSGSLKEEKDEDLVPTLYEMDNSSLFRRRSRPKCQICGKRENPSEKKLICYCYCNDNKNLVHHKCLINHVRYLGKQNACPCSVCGADYTTIKKLIPLHQRILFWFGKRQWNSTLICINLIITGILLITMVRQFIM